MSQFSPFGIAAYAFIVIELIVTGWMLGWLVRILIEDATASHKGK